MRKLLCLLVIFLLIFTYSIPAYAEDIFDENNVVSQDEENGDGEEESEESALKDDEKDDPSGEDAQEEGVENDGNSENEESPPVEEDSNQGEAFDEGEAQESDDTEEEATEKLPEPLVPLGNPSVFQSFAIQGLPNYNLNISSFNSNHVVYVNENIETHDAMHGSIIEQYIVSNPDMGKDPLIAIKGMDAHGNVAALGVEYEPDGGSWHYSDGSWMIHVGTPPIYEAPNGDTFKWYEEGYKSNDWIPAHEITSHGFGTGNFLKQGGEWIWSEHYGASSGGLDKTVYFRNKLEGHDVIELHPIFEGYVDNGDGTYRAYFGYENKSVDALGDPMDVNIPMDTPENKITGNADDSLFPEDFTYPNVIPGRPGRTDWFPNALVEIPDWDGTTVVWTLDGRTATAGLGGPEHIYYEITFNSNGGSSVPSQSILEGEMVIEPTAPTRSGYTFTGWNYEGSSYDFGWPVVEDMTLIASWSRNSTGGGTTGGGDDATIEAVTDNLSTLQNESVSVATSVLMANDIDADDFVSVQNPINGSVNLSGSTVTFTPDTDFIGTAYFYYTIEDGGDSDNGLVIVSVEEAVVINPETTPLGNGNPDELLVINPEITPLGVIDYSMPYIMGYPDVTFRPEREVTRAEMSAIFARILGLDLSNPGEPMYQDVSPKDWYYKYVQAVTRVGLFNGYDNNMFKPNRPVSHAEIASAFSEYWDLKGIEVASEGDYFSDINGHWAEAMINRLYNAGISVTYPDRTFRPNRFTTRTELVVMVNRSLNRAEQVKEASSFSDVLQSHWGYGAIEAATGYVEPESMSLSE